MDKKDISREAEHAKKIVAPVVIAVLLGLYYIAMGVVFLCIPGALVLLKILAALIPAALAGVILFVLVERIEEIRSGEVCFLERSSRSDWMRKGTFWMKI